MNQSGTLPSDRVQLCEIVVIRRGFPPHWGVPAVACRSPIAPI
jgi:hypothetical protein